MPRTVEKLSAKAVESTVKPGMYADGGGLYLQVASPTRKSWIFRYSSGGKPRWCGLGSAFEGGLTLKQARAERDAKREQLRQGIDPIEAQREKRQRRTEDAPQVVTFREAATKYIGAMEPGWRNAKHRQQWTSTLETYAFPLLGDMPVADVGTAKVLEVLEPIWSVKLQTAMRLRGRIERVLNWAKTRDLREGENPAQWRGHLENSLPKPGALRKVKPIKHHAALPYADMPDFMSRLRAHDGMAAKALEFAILTAARTGEVLGARWDEIGLDSALWTIGAARMGKTARDHRVPLSPAAVALLRDVRQLSGHFDVVFPNLTRGAPLSNMSMLKQLERMDRSDITPHGFRSTFRDWAAERTNYQNHVVEMALAHTIGSAVEAAYRRGDLLDIRRRLMDEWSAYCESGTSQTHVPNVVPMRA